MRVVFVPGIVLTLLTLVPTLVYLDQFPLDDGSRTAQLVAWFWSSPPRTSCSPEKGEPGAGSGLSPQTQLRN